MNGADPAWPRSSGARTADARDCGPTKRPPNAACGTGSSTITVPAGASASATCAVAMYERPDADVVEVSKPWNDQIDPINRAVTRQAVTDRTCWVRRGLRR